MPARLRKPIGLIALVLFVMVYAWIAMDVGDLVIASKTKLTQVVFFVLAGVAWLPPAMAIIWWIYRRQKA
jgi:hypothetical protein